MTLHSSRKNNSGIGSAQSAPHHFYAVDHSADITLEQRSVGHTLSTFSHSCFSLFRWPWSPPLHRNNVRVSGPQLPPQFESSRFNDSIHHTLRFSTPRGQTHATVKNRRPRDFTPHPQPNSFPSGSSTSIFCRSSAPSSRCLQCLTQSESVSLPTSSRPWLAVTTAISPRCGGISQHPAVASPPATESQWSTSVFVVCPAS